MSILHIPDDVLNRAGISEREAVLELACHLYSTGKLTLFFGAKLAGMTTGEFEDALLDRGMVVHHYDETDLKRDRDAMGKLKG